LKLGGTIACGFLTVSLLSTLAYKCLPMIEGAVLGINYGFDKLRFMSPVKAGARVRARFKLADLDIRPPRRVVNTYEVALELEGLIKPAFTATWLTIAMAPPEE
jgi:acyl dehydratase